MRLSARLDPVRERRLREIQLLTGWTASDVVKQALDLLHRRQIEQSKGRLDALLSSDFIACADGPEGLATEYKRYLTDGLEGKHGPR